jgi:peptide/nickel transport system substrate-binding protein
MPYRATCDYGVVYDPYTGLVWPQRIEKAELTAEQGLPITSTLDWMKLSFVPQGSITVPADTWVDWDAKTQKFITAAEKFPSGITSKTKVTVYYPADLYTTVKWHDGSPFSVADVVNYMILQFDPAKQDSPIYDESQVPNEEGFLSHFKGIRIVSTDPLVIETYDDSYALDAEMSVINFNYTWFPWTNRGELAWHSYAIGVKAETKQELAFTAEKADALGVDWMSYITGPSLEILKKYMDEAAAENYIPYAPTLSQYITADEAKARWANYEAWYAKMGHFWIGTGPFYLDKAYPVEKTVTLQRNPDYPDPADKWSRFSAPKIAVVDIVSTGPVTVGQEATFDVSVTYEDAPYPTSEIAFVKYLLFDSTGKMVASGDATNVQDGQYKVTLPVSATKLLAAGSNKLEVVVSSAVVSIPTFASYEFVAVAP